MKFFCLSKSLYVVWSLVSFPNIAIILLMKRPGLLHFACVVAVCDLCLFLAVLRVGLRSIIVAFSGHTHSLAFCICFLGTQVLTHEKHE